MLPYFDLMSIEQNALLETDERQPWDRGRPARNERWQARRSVSAVSSDDHEHSVNNHGGAGETPAVPVKSGLGLCL